MLDLILVGGDVYDGSGEPPTRTDIGIQAGRIVRLEEGARSTSPDCRSRPASSILTRTPT